ncbi:MAG: tetratricopeptide repeat protein, partial [Planctomycetales bacterium]|nr:tetratricopeptide repeat protein [Planctomycetales bacterium]
MLLASAQFQRGKYDEAMKAAADGLRHFPDLGGLDLVIGKCLEQQGKLAEALAAFNKAAQLAPDDWVCQLA